MKQQKKLQLSPELLQEARGWILDCKGDWRDIHSKEDVNSLTQAEIEAGLEVHYSGGLQGFIANCGG